MAISFYLKNPAQQTSPVYVSFRYDGKRLQSSTGWKVEVKTWNKKKGLPKPQISSEKYQATKKHLNRVTKILESIYQEKKSLGLVPAPRFLKSYLDDKLFQVESGVSPEDDKSVIKKLDEFIQTNHGLLADGTVAKYRTLLKYLSEFSIYKKIRLGFEDINKVFEDDFRKWLLNYPQRFANSKTEKGMLNDTVSKYFSCLKTFMKWSFDRGYHFTTDFMTFSAKKASRHEIIVLNEDEIERIQNLQLGPFPGKIRDLFIFMIYTGQRWGDVQKFDRSQIDGTIWKFKQQKTEKLVEIPLVGFAEPAYAILKKYRFQLPKLVNQVFNREIKIVCQLAEIDSPISLERKQGNKAIVLTGKKWEFVSAHTARRTATTLLLKRGVPPTTVMKFTGHDSLKTLMKYEQTSLHDLETALRNASDLHSDGLMRVLK